MHREWFLQVQQHKKADFSLVYPQKIQTLIWCYNDMLKDRNFTSTIFKQIKQIVKLCSPIMLKTAYGGLIVVYFKGKPYVVIIDDSKLKHNSN